MSSEKSNYGEDPKTLDRRSKPRYTTHGETEIPLTPRFALGTVVATKGALEFLTEHFIAPHRLAYRHQSGDYGDLDAGDIFQNELP